MLAPDPFLAPRFRTRLWRWPNAGAHYLVASFAVSLAAWLGSLPLIAYYFHLLTPVSLIANMVVVPLSSGALACNLATLALGWLCPSAGELFNNCAWFLMLLMVKVSEWAAGISVGVFHARTPSLTDFVFYYALLLAVFSGWLWREHLRKWAAGAMVAAVVPLAGGWWHNETSSEMVVLPLNGGSGIYVKHGDEWLIDCGDLHSGQHITKPFLQARGINRLPHLLLTHGDVRHVEAAPLLHQTFAAQNLYMSPIRFRSAPYRRVQEHFRTNGVKVTTVAAGQHLGIWEVLHPGEDTKFSQADDNTIVLFGKIFGQRILLLSDLGTPGQNALLERSPDLQADMIVTGLPRESEPVADGFLDIVQPKIIIVVDSELPAQERASERLRARLRQRGIQVIYTSDAGAITVNFLAGGGFAIQTMNSSGLD
jgi:beta-lactamase superfamily II metal-dependent hydrolase